MMTLILYELDVSIASLGNFHNISDLISFAGHNPMEITLGFLALIIGILMLDQKPPTKEEPPKDEIVYKIEVKKPK
jgi:hypothetical protein